MLTEVDQQHSLCRSLSDGLAALQRLWRGETTSPLEEAALSDLLTALKGIHDERGRLDMLFATPATLSATGRSRVGVPNRIPADNALAVTIEGLTTVVCGERNATPHPRVRVVQQTCVTLLEHLQRSRLDRTHAELAS